MSGHKPFRELTQEIRVNRSTWQRALLDLFKRDKEVSDLTFNLKSAHRTIEARCKMLKECREEVDVLQQEIHARDDARTEGLIEGSKAGREDVLVFLRSFGYSEPPRLSGRGLAAMVEKHLARNDEIRDAGRAQSDKGTIAGSVKK